MTSNTISTSKSALTMPINAKPYGPTEPLDHAIALAVKHDVEPARFRQINDIEHVYLLTTVTGRGLSKMAKYIDMTDYFHGCEGTWDPHTNNDWSLGANNNWEV